MRAAEPTPPVDPTRSDLHSIHLYHPQNQLGDLLLNVPARDARLESVTPEDVLEVTLPLLAEERCAVG